MLTRMLYKGAEAAVSILTITSNTAYAKQTSHMPGRRGVYLNPDGSLNDSELEFFPPGANPTSKARGGWLDNLRTLSSLDFGKANDGISLTTQVAPKALGKTFEEQVENRVTILDGYFESGDQHMNLERPQPGRRSRQDHGGRERYRPHQRILRQHQVPDG